MTHCSISMKSVERPALHAVACMLFASTTAGHSGKSAVGFEFNLVGCFSDIQQSTNYARVLPTFFCSSGAGATSVPYPTCEPQAGFSPDQLGYEGYAGAYNMSYETCNALCEGHALFGLEDFGQCFCGDQMATTEYAPPGSCSTPCSGDPNQVCGGNTSIRVFNTSVPKLQPVPPVLYVEVGCLLDAQANPQHVRVLPDFFCSNGLSTSASYPTCAPQPRNIPGKPGLSGYAGVYNMTRSMCNDLCAGYSYFGIAGAGECYCGNNLQSTTVAPTGGCSTQCAGSSQLCGGPSAIRVFHTSLAPAPTPKPFHHLGCFLDTQPSDQYQRVLPTFFCSNGLDGAVPYRSCAPQAGFAPGEVGYDGYAGEYNMTYELCNAICAGHPLFGIEQEGQCFCGETLNVEGYAPPGSCSQPCSGDKNEMCGGIKAIRVFSTSAEPVPSEIPYHMIGCSLDVQASFGYARVLPTFFCANGRDTSTPYPTCAPQVNATPNQVGYSGFAGYYNMTHEACNAMCQGFTYFGVEAGGECYCGNKIQSQGSPPPGSCSTPCSGNAGEQCGGENILRIFSTSPSYGRKLSPNPAVCAPDDAIADCTGLTALADALGWQHWVNSTNWMTQKTICSWFGVTCTSGRVTSVVLSKNNVSGAIPEALGNLTHLSIFSLDGGRPSTYKGCTQCNLWNSSIPNALYSMTNLTSINLEYCCLGGGLSEKIGALTQLTELSVHGNYVSGPLPKVGTPCCYSFNDPH